MYFLCAAEICARRLNGLRKGIGENCAESEAFGGPIVGGILVKWSVNSFITPTARSSPVRERVRDRMESIRAYNISYRTRERRNEAQVITT